LPADSEADLDEDRVFAASSPAGFGMVATRGDMGPYIPARFHVEIAKAVVDVTEGRLDVLILQVPVQHGKTTTASVLTAAQFLGTHPNKFVVAVSYASAFAADRIGRQARNMLERHGAALFDVTVDPRSSARDRWNTTQGGGLATFGIEKGVAGRRADLLIVDDPYPGMAEAASKAFRDMAWDRYRFELATRLAPGAGQIHIMSRWGEDDHIARVIALCKEANLHSRVIDFPALSICEVCQDFGLDRVNACGHGVRDALGRLPGEALWPEVRSRDFVLQARLTVGFRAFDALYQGRPRPDGGLMFKRSWFRYATLTDGILKLEKADGTVRIVKLADCRRVQMVDLAASTATGADYFVIETFAVTPPPYEVVTLDVVRGRFTAGEQLEQLKAAARKWSPYRQGIEAVGYQLAFYQLAIDAGLPAYRVNVTKGKEHRAMVAAARYEGGAWYHLKGASWLDAFETELLGFPTAEHDDQVDPTSMMAQVLSELAASSGPAQGIRIG
jgi:predicted phage terminase large subunit-like protein